MMNRRDILKGLALLPGVGLLAPAGWSKPRSGLEGRWSDLPVNDGDVGPELGSRVVVPREWHVPDGYLVTELHEGHWAEKYYAGVGRAVARDVDEQIIEAFFNTGTL